MIAAAIPIGRLTKKIQRQERFAASAEQRPDGHRQAGDSPDAECDAMVLPWKAEASSHREHDRPADSLNGARELEHQRADREAAQHRRAGEHHQANQPQQAAAVHVRQAARGQQERRQCQRIGINDPLQVGEARVQRLLDIWQGDIHDRDVQQQHEHAQAHRDQRPPLASAAGRGRMEVLRGRSGGRGGAGGSAGRAGRKGDALLRSRPLGARIGHGDLPGRADVYV
jgi:hypothetical protein